MRVLEITHRHQLLASYQNLTPAQRSLAINKLNYQERLSFYRLVREPDLHNRNGNDKNWHRIKKILCNTKNLSVNLTKNTYSSSQKQLLWQKIRHIVSDILFLFQIVTPDKAHALLDKIIRKQSLSGQASHAKRNTVWACLTVARKKKVPLATVLKKKGFSPNIKGMDFFGMQALKSINLEGVSFINCKLQWNSFAETALKDVKFKYCTLENISFMNAHLEKCEFDNCDVRETMFTGASLKQVQFDTSNIISCSFEDAIVEGCLFQRVIMPGTHFFEASVQNMQITNSDIREAHFFEVVEAIHIDKISQKTMGLSKPTTAFLVHPEMRGITTPKANIKLDQRAGTIPLRITFQPQRIKKAILNQEMEEVIKKVSTIHERVPIPQKILTEISQNPQQYPSSATIINKAIQLAKTVDSFFLPGGEDLPPALYGAIQKEKTDWGNDYRRSLFELAIFHHSLQKGVPLMGVCRGFQIGQIYCGAKLDQHVTGHKKVQLMTLFQKRKALGLYENAIKEGLASANCHHQAVPSDSAATERMETILQYRGTVKAAELTHPASVPMILIQFHPEFYRTSTADSLKRELIDGIINLRISEENEMFWKIFADSVKAHRIRKQMITLLKKRRSLN